MMPLIDQQIEMIDKRHASLTALNNQLNSALNLYHDLMKESLMMDQAAAAALYAQQQQQSMGNIATVSGGYGSYHPPMAQQIVQPAPYDSNNISGHQIAYGPGGASASVVGQHYYGGRLQPYQTQQPVYDGGQQQQQNIASVTVTATAQQPQSVPVMMGPEQQLPPASSVPGPGAYHPSLYQRCSFFPSTMKQLVYHPLSVVSAHPTMLQKYPLFPHSFLTSNNNLIPFDTNNNSNNNSNIAPNCSRVQRNSLFFAKKPSSTKEVFVDDTTDSQS